MTPVERAEYARETHRIAVANAARAESLWDLIFPPWRWRQWHRVYREVKRDLA